MTRWRKVKKATSRILRIRKKKAPSATGPTIDELAADVKTAVSLYSAALFAAVGCLPCSVLWACGSFASCALSVPTDQFCAHYARQAWYTQM